MVQEAACAQLSDNRFAWYRLRHGLCGFQFAALSHGVDSQVLALNTNAPPFESSLLLLFVCEVDECVRRLAADCTTQSSW